MRVRISLLVRNIVQTYWFIPTAMVIAAIALAVFTVYLDWELGWEWSKSFAGLQQTHPDGARAILSTIAGSMITVAGVTFSMTIAAVSYASAQFGPRLIGNFMRDKGNQFTLGTFVATFTYCLIVLRSVRSAEEVVRGGPSGVESFVPHFSLIVALALALASVAVLIYFIHHVPETINISNITANIGGELKRNLQSAFPEKRVRELVIAAPFDLDRRLQESVPIYSEADCYIQSIDEKGLCHFAESQGLMIRLEYRSCVFVATGERLAHVWPPEKMTEDLPGKILSYFSWNTDKTKSNDFLYLVDELLEMTARALSPGVNDPFTAINCSNWLKAALIEISRREAPQSHMYDESGELRVVKQPIDFDFLCDHIFNQTRAYTASDRNTALHEMRIFCDIGALTEDESHREKLMEHAKLLLEASSEALPLKSDQQRLMVSFVETKAVLSREELRRGFRNQNGWLESTTPL